MDDGTDALRQLAPCWSLAGDDKLLDILQNTHQNIVSKCKEVNEKLGGMAAALDDAAISLQNVNNRFMSLSSRQFIESRVYDDDADVALEPTPVKEPPKVATQDSTMDSIRRSLCVLERTHELLTILHDSDTDTDSDDDVSVRTVLKPIDVYASRPLPYIIGSQQWKSKWHAGLVAEDSDSDSSTKRSERSEQYSDSEPESAAQPDTLRPPRPAGDRTISETSLELPSDQDVMPPQIDQPKPSDIAAELARRLGGHLPKMSEPEPEYEPLPAAAKLHKPPHPNTGPVFSDEPPPPPQDSSSEEDVDIFAELHRKQPYSDPRSLPDLFTTRPQGDLFGEEDEIAEGDIFSDFAKPITGPSVERDSPLFRVVPEPKISTEKTPAARNVHDVDIGAKKPVGGISLFGTNKSTESIGAAILKRNRRNSSTSGEESGSDPPVHQTKSNSHSEAAIEETESAKRQKDIFDDLFARAQKVDKAKPKRAILKDIESEVKKKNEPKIAEAKKVDLFSDNIFDDIDDIFSTSAVKMPENTKQKSIFEDNDDELFSEMAAPKTVQSEAKNSNKNKKSLFESDDELFTENVSKTKIVENISKTNDPNIPKNLISVGSTIANPIKSIFDDDEEDLFNNVKNVTQNSSYNKKVQNNNVGSSNDIKNKETENISKPNETKVFNSPSLFDDDDETELFAVSTKSSHPHQMITAANVENDNRSSLNIDNDMFYIENKSILPKESDDSKIVGKTDDTLNNLNVNIVSNEDSDKTNATEKSNGLENMNALPKSIDISQNIKQYITKSTTAEDSDFEQDFDDLPPGNEEQSNVNNKINTGTNMAVNINVVTEIKSEEVKVTDSFDNEDELFTSHKSSKVPLEISVQTQSQDTTVAISKEPVENSMLSDQLDDKPSVGKVEKTVEKSSNENNMKENFTTSNDLLAETNTSLGRNGKSKIINTIETSIEIKKDIGFSDDLENSNTSRDISEQPPFANINTSKVIFDDLFIEPPIFEKPREPKKSKNVNALFDDDSEDEALFFKKSDVITDEIPGVFKTSQDNLFGLFRDEPPDVSLKVESDEDIFVTLPKPDLPEVNAIPDSNTITTTNYNEHTSILKETKITSDENDSLDVPTSNSGERLSNSLSKIDKPYISNRTKPPTNEVGQQLANTLSDDEELFKIIPKTETIVSSTQSDESVTLSGTFTGNDNNLFNTQTQAKPVISELLKDESRTSPSSDDNLFKPETYSDPIPSSAHAETQLKTSNTIETLSNTLFNNDDELFKTIPNDISVDLNKSVSNTPSTEEAFDTKQENEKSNKESPKKVGKLRTMNFNINVNALLPGSSPKKQKASEEPSPTESIDTTDDKIPESKTTKAVNFDESESGILDNKLSKERPKIQVKRRPSTRRARKEAARKSGIDFGEDSTDNSSSIDDPPKPPITPDETSNTTDKIIEPEKVTDAQANIETEHSQNLDRPYGRDVKSKVVYILNDEDIFDTAALKSNINNETESETSNTVPTLGKDYDKTESSIKASSIFDDRNEMVQKKTERSIFDSDSDGELFSTSKKEKNLVRKIEKGPLFSDDDDDDLFGVKAKRKEEPTPHASKSPAPAKGVPMSTEVVLDDPLSMLGEGD